MEQIQAIQGNSFAHKLRKSYITEYFFVDNMLKSNRKMFKSCLQACV